MSLYAPQTKVGVATSVLAENSANAKVCVLQMIGISFEVMHMSTMGTVVSPFFVSHVIHFGYLTVTVNVL